MRVDQREEIVPQADVRRKSRARRAQYVALFAAAAVVAFPVSFVGGMLLTPVLWRLEPVVGLELAGHSGPSDWVLETMFGITTVVLFSLGVWLTRLGRAKASSELFASRDSHSS